MRKHLTQTVPMPRWWIYLVILLFVLIDIDNENWIGLAIFVTAAIGFHILTRLRYRHKDSPR
jgi:hypothetical protein